jgi:hypothetical protein
MRMANGFDYQKYLEGARALVKDGDALESSPLLNIDISKYVESLRHLPQRMHDQEKNYSPAFKRLEDQPVAEPVMRREPQQHRPHSIHDPGSLEDVLEALRTLHEEREYTDEERKRAYETNPFLVDLSPPKEDPPGQDLSLDKALNPNKERGVRDGGTIRYQGYDARGRRK